MKMWQEQQIIRRFRSGDAEAFGELFDLYNESIFRYVMLRSGSREDAEDITSSAFERLLEASIEKPIRNIRPFLFKIARNLLIDYYRLQKRQSLPLEYAESVTAAQAPVDPHEQKALVKALANLPEDYQEALILHYIEDLNAGEIAQIMEKSSGATRVLLHRAKKALKKELSSNHV